MPRAEKTGSILRHGDPQLPQRAWHGEPVVRNIGDEVKKIAVWMNTENTGWAGDLNASRQLFQNEHPGFSFADHWANYLQEFKSQHDTPQTILEISIGPDGALLENHLNIFPDAEIWVIEANKDNIEAAKNKLMDKDYQLDKVRFERGDAANSQVYEKMPQFDIITANNVIQHIATEGVPDPPLTTLLNTLTGKLASNGSLLIGDLAVDQWGINPATGYAADPEVIEKVNQCKFYMHGGQTPDGGQFPGAIALGWPISRQATAFRDAGHIAEVIEKHSGGKFAPVPGTVSTLEIRDMGPDDPATIITAYIPATLVAGLRGSIETDRKDGKDTQQKEKALAALTHLGLVYLNTLTDSRFSGVFPPHYIQAFQLTNK